MATSSGVIAPRSEAEEFFRANPDVDSIEMIYTDFGGVPRGKRLRQHEVLAVYESGRMFPGSITVVDITGQDTVETGLVWEDGDADRSMKPSRRTSSSCARAAAHRRSRSASPWSPVRWQKPSPVRKRLNQRSDSGIILPPFAPMAESVDAADSKSAAERCASSSLARGTK